jgi:hypothetical protein
VAGAEEGGSGGKRSGTGARGKKRGAVKGRSRAVSVQVQEATDQGTEIHTTVPLEQQLPFIVSAGVRSAAK